MRWIAVELKLVDKKEAMWSGHKNLVQVQSEYNLEFLAGDSLAEIVINTINDNANVNFVKDIRTGKLRVRYIVEKERIEECCFCRLDGNLNVGFNQGAVKAIGVDIALPYCLLKLLKITNKNGEINVSDLAATELCISGNNTRISLNKLVVSKACIDTINASVFIDNINFEENCSENKLYCTNKNGDIIVGVNGDNIHACSIVGTMTNSCGDNIVKMPNVTVVKNDDGIKFYNNVKNANRMIHIDFKNKYCYNRIVEKIYDR